MPAALIWPLLSLARAEPVVHAGAADDALRTAEDRLGAGERAAVAFSDLVRRPPTLLAGGTAKGCDRAPSEPLGTSLDRLRQALMFGELEPAATDLDDAEQAALCGAATTAELARLELLAGVLALEQGDEALARARFRAARWLQPTVAWDDAFPPPQRAVFDAVAQEPPAQTVPLQVRPATGSVDGGPPGQVAPGDHWVRFDGQAVRLTLDPVANTVVFPAAFPPDALSWMADEARRRDLTALLSVGLGEGVAATVVLGEDAWTGTTGRVDWTLHPGPVPEPAPAVPPVGAEVRRSPAPWLVAAGGAAVFGGGSLLSGLASLDAARHRDAADAATDANSWRAEVAAYEARPPLIRAGWALMAAGGVGAGAGLVWGVTR